MEQDRPDGRQMADALRVLAMDAVEAARSGHPGMPMGMADVAARLFGWFLKFDPADEHWPDRDRFVLSAGHGSMLLYGVLALTGYRGMGLDELRRFRQLGSKTPGHPEYGLTPGVEATTGPLGQGLGMAVGMALAEQVLATRFGSGLVDHRTWVVVGDGCLMEGISQEALDFAGHHRLRKLTVLFDDNRISIDGSVSLSSSTDQLARARASGWDCVQIDGHDHAAIHQALEACADQTRPTLIACRTQIAFGSPGKGGTASSHGAPLGAEEVARVREQLGWDWPPFEIPEPIRAAWQQAGRRGEQAHAAWRARKAELGPEKQAEFDRVLAGTLPDGWQAGLKALREEFARERPKMATRAASQKVLDLLGPAIPELLGGSADLTGSNNTRPAGASPLSADQPDGTYLHYGIREFGMATILNGLRLHGGLIPYGGTFLCFSDYLRPALRLAALMRLPVIHVFSHDSIGLGEDGPTHQPIEHLAALRAIPGLDVLRPADAIELAECWELALERTRDSEDGGPTALVLTRQAVACLGEASAENRSRTGARVWLDPGPERDVTLIASGSEVEIAFAAHQTLAGQGIRAALVSMPSWRRFAQQSREFQAQVLGTAPRIGIEAGCAFGWERWLGPDGILIGLDHYGESAPGPDLYRHFGLTPERVCAQVQACLERKGN